MKRNSDILLAGDDALGYLAGPMHKKYSMTFIWSHPFRTCGSYDQFFNPFYITPSAHMYVFRVPPPFVYVILSIWYRLSRFEFACLKQFPHIVLSQKFRNTWLNLSSLLALFLSDTHNFLASDSVPSSLHWKAFSLTVAFKLLVILPFIIADDFKGELLL